MGIRTVLVCETQVPFVRGGAELLVRQLVSELRRRGYETDRVSVPFKWYPKDEILTHAAAWRLLDLTESNSRPVDLVIATKFPTYFARHPRKVCWLVHQHRAAYELADTEYSDFGHDERDVGLKARLLALDEQMLGECVGRYTISRTVTDRLRRFTGSTRRRFCIRRRWRRGSGGRLRSLRASVARLEGNKRVDLVAWAMRHALAGLSLVIVGDGSHRWRVEQAVEEAGVADRVRFAGAVSDDAGRAHRGALGLVYVPFDDWLATLEAFLAAKPVVWPATRVAPSSSSMPTPGCVLRRPAMARRSASSTVTARGPAPGRGGPGPRAAITWDA